MNSEVEIRKLYEDENVLAIDKPAGIVVFPEGATNRKSLIDCLSAKYPLLKEAGMPPRYGIVHRLDKDTSGILLVAKTNQALAFFQNQFKKGLVEKKYLTLVVGRIKDNGGTIETLIGRSPKDKRKQRVYLAGSPEAKRKKLRGAKTIWKKVAVFSDDGQDYAFLEVNPKTGRRHQIRSHLAHIGYPVAGDKLYSFKNRPVPKGLTRQFLHASSLKIRLPNGEEKEFSSELPDDLKEVLKNLTLK